MFHNVDLLRGLGALFIMIFHASYIYGLGRPTEAHFLVDLFFVMSGFVIPFRYETDLQNGLTLTTFAKIRFVRLYPLFLLGTVLGVVPALVAVACGHVDAFHRGLAGSFPLAVFMLPSSLAQPKVEMFYPLNYVSWSLTLELLVNLTYAATVRVWTTRRALALTFVAFLCLALCAGVYGSLDGGPTWANAPVGPVRAIFGFGVGLLLYRLYQRKPFALSLPWWVLPIVVFAVALSGAPTNKPAWDLVLATVFVPFAIYVALATEPPARLRRLCALGGVLSYPIYCIHVPLIGLFLYAEETLHLGGHAPTALGAIVFTVLAVGSVLAAHYAFDTPIRRLLTKRWISRKRKPRPDAVVAGAMGLA